MTIRKRSYWLRESVMVLLPTDSNTYTHGITVNAKNVTETTVKTTHGILR